jgi:hypothetical protein
LRSTPLISTDSTQKRRIFFTAWTTSNLEVPTSPFSCLWESLVVNSGLRFASKTRKSAQLRKSVEILRLSKTNLLSSKLNFQTLKSTIAWWKSAKS